MPLKPEGRTSFGQFGQQFRRGRIHA
jgi:hypothetical protein